MADEDCNACAEKTAEDHAANIGALDDQIAKVNEDAANHQAQLVKLKAERERAEAERQLASLKADHAKLDGNPQAQKAVQQQIDQHQSLVNVAKAKFDALNGDAKATDIANGKPQPKPEEHQS